MNQCLCNDESLCGGHGFIRHRLDIFDLPFQQVVLEGRIPITLNTESFHHFAKFPFFLQFFHLKSAKRLQLTRICVNIDLEVLRWQSDTSESKSSFLDESVGRAEYLEFVPNLFRFIVSLGYFGEVSNLDHGS